MTYPHRLALGWLIIVCIGASTSMCGPAHAAPPPLALAIARVSANEGALYQPLDVDLICQTVRGQGETLGQQYEWLSRHSGKVMKRKPCLHGNCLWTRNLTRRVHAVPAGLSVSPSWWRHIAAPRWAEVLRRARQCVLGLLPDVCKLTPTTWDGRRWIRKAAKKGLFPAHCDKRTLNEGFRPVRFEW